MFHTHNSLEQATSPAHQHNIHVTITDSPLQCKGLHQMHTFGRNIDIEICGSELLNVQIQVEKDEEYIKSVTALGAVIEDLVKANNAVDIYEDYFAGQVSYESDMHAKVMNT